MDEPRDASLYEGLLALLQGEFPKTCPKCGRGYASLEAFVEETDAASDGSGLMGYDLGNGARQVAVVRTCGCGTSIATFCNDRRDSSEGGLRRRALFDNLLAQLARRGVDEPTARGQLLAYLRGEGSPLLEDLGFPARRAKAPPAA